VKQITLWLDAQLPPKLAPWLQENFAVEAWSVRDLGLRDAEDADIFDAAREAGATVVTKDSDFLDLIGRYGAPPQILLITCGNTSNARLRVILTDTLPQALLLLSAGEAVVEISDAKGDTDPV